MSATAVSMTAFASRRGQGQGVLAGHSWAWEMRGVNGKGLDLRLRLPDWVEGLEVAIRQELARRLARGNVTLNLRLTRETGGEGLRLNPAGLAVALGALAAVETAATAAGVATTAPTTTEVLGLRGVVETTNGDGDTAPLLAVLLADFRALLDAFVAMRAAEGAALVAVLGGQLDAVTDLLAAARAAAAARAPRAELALNEAMRRVLGAVEVDPARVAQELALLAVKADVTEELDRLDAHVAAARALLAGGGGPVGRKFDFLAQEFNREANTLCAKAGDIELTRIGLDLKHTIDQLREQVQNLE